MAVIGDLVTRLSVDGRNFQSGLSKAQGQAKSFAASVGSIVSGIAIADIGGKAIGGILSLGQSVAQLAADAQTAQIQFEVLTGSAEKGAALFKDVERFAARTSFNLESAADATKSLLASGVADTQIMSTLQLLGDLAMGDANKLGFLSKAYTDVMNKGKLQGQEIRQFAENGVGIIGALSKTLNKSTSEILTMSEAGQISFTDMQTALLSLTGEGGRFHDMMARINETFTGQWNSLVENVQTLGREIGTAVLPNLTSMVTVANEILQKFNMLPDKMKFLSDVLTASFDVVVESIKVKWDEMLAAMIAKAWEAGKNIAKAMSPTNWGLEAGQSLRDHFTGNADAAAAQGVTPLQEAQNRLGGLMNTLQSQELPPAPAASDLAAALPQAVDGSKLTALFGTAMEKAAPLLAGAKQFGETKVTEWKTWGEGLKGTAENWLGNDVRNESAMQGAKTEKQTSGAMFSGQADTWSTVIASMFGAKQDPMIKETKSQTKQIVDALKNNGPGKAAPVFKEFVTA